MIDQKSFDNMLKFATPDEDRCVFEGCVEEPYITIQVKGKRYGVCRNHWLMIMKADIKW